MVDLTYKNQGLFTAFLPESKAGEEAFRAICKAQGDHTGKVLTIHAKSTIAQLRKAGYSVKKQGRTEDISADELEALLA